VAPAAIGVINIGDIVQGTLTNDHPTIGYTFNGQAGQMIIITQTSSDFDCYLTLNDSNGNMLTSDDDSGEDTNAQIGPYALPATGSYTIVADSYDNNSGSGMGTGSFTLSLMPVTVKNIEYTQMVNGNLTTTENNAIYSFHGQGGDTITIAMNSSD